MTSPESSPISTGGETNTPFLSDSPMADGNEPVYKVIRLVAKSPDSWEDAARIAVSEAASSIAHLSYAKVTAMDSVSVDGEIISYRIRMELAFQLDRSRPSAIAGRSPVVVKRYLIVADRTEAGDRIPRLVAERAAAGPAEFHILVPATRSKETLQLIAGGGDPMSGFSVVTNEHLAAARALDRERAEARLQTFLRSLEPYRSAITSEVGQHDPFAAIAQVLERSSFDEIIISTFPSMFSRPLRIDLVNRLRRRYHLPVVEINPPKT